MPTAPVRIMSAIVAPVELGEHLAQSPPHGERDGIALGRSVEGDRRDTVRFHGNDNVLLISHARPLSESACMTREKWAQ